ncbi:MAG: hypothetical protein LBI44_08455 [Oscillospiraceae bacterium]|jgi:hypothetical protein|nr:hypothetical protein [Oscillospiraceae bacterium]
MEWEPFPFDGPDTSETRERLIKWAEAFIAELDGGEAGGGGCTAGRGGALAEESLAEAERIGGLKVRT